MQILDSLIEGVMCLADTDPRAARDLLMAEVAYLYDGREPDAMRASARAVFVSVRPNLENSRKRADAGRAGGSKPRCCGEANDKANSQANKQANDKAKQQANEQANMPIPGKRIGIGEVREETPPDGGVEKPRKRRAPFSAPSTGDVSAYASETGLSIDAARFCDFYASKGWKVGKDPMRDWRAAVRNWARRDDDDASPRGVACHDVSRFESIG